MAYTKEKKDECFDWIIENIESGKSLIWCLNSEGMPSTETFYKWLEQTDENGVKTEDANEKTKRYARACEVRELLILDEIIEIADKQSEDIIDTDKGKITNHNVIQRNKLQIEARQWLLGKLRPEKYGTQKIQTEHSGEITTNVISLGNGVKPNETNT